MDPAHPQCRYSQQDGFVIKLCKGLYGLKQVAALWYDDVRSTLTQLGLLPTTSDICLYTNGVKDLFVLIHVADFQGQYARILLSRHSLSDCKIANTPMERMMESNNKKFLPHEKTEYNSSIGGIQYLSNNTGPDIAFAVNHLARFLTNPSKEHMQAARQVLRYIAKDPDHGITFTRSNHRPILEAYTDADFAADTSTS
ncbi:hypothetical protein K3495_g13282 [Podosphaera aphanis]|nr:hypothetical protein K3495_g13282 [Podosphaera aphanis]